MPNSLTLSRNSFIWPFAILHLLSFLCVLFPTVICCFFFSTLDDFFFLEHEFYNWFKVLIFYYIVYFHIITCHQVDNNIIVMVHICTNLL